MRHTFAVLLLFLSASCLRAATPPGGLVVQSWRYDATKTAAIVRLLNESDKDISAYSISVTITTKDGNSYTTEHATDYLPMMASVQIHNLQGHGNGTFEARSHKDEIIGSTQEVTNLSIVVSAVIYSDRTADIKDVRAFQAMVEQRKNETAAEQQATEIMKKAGSPQEAKQELERVLKASTGEQQVTFSMIANNLKYATTMSDLKDEITGSEARANFYGPHLQMTDVKQPTAVQQ